MIFSNFIKTSSFAIILVMVGFSFLLSFEVEAQVSQRNSTGTITIEDGVEVRDIEIPDLNITPPIIEEGEDMVFETDPVFFEGSTDPAVGVECRFNIETGEGEVIIIEGETNSSGVCSFDTSLTPAEQGLTVISGDVSKINTDIGIGSARVVFNHKDEDLETSIENFTVNESGEINVGDFDIIEEEINVGDGINLTIGPVTSSEGDPIPDLPLKIVIKIPGGSELILEGNTNENGELEFDSSKDLEDQGIKIIQGNIEDISKIEGEFTGYVEVEHDGEVVRTNFDSYVVESENTIPEVVRTGAFNGGIIILIALSVFILAYILKDRYGKPLESDD